MAARSHNPEEKPVKQVLREERERAERTERFLLPPDRVPSDIHDRQMLDALGGPAFAEAFLTYIAGQSVQSLRLHRLHRVLGELDALHPKIFTIMAASYRFPNWSQQDIAGALLYKSHATISRGLTSGHRWLAVRYVELYPDGT